MKHTIPTIYLILSYIFNRQTRELWMLVCFGLYMCTAIPYVSVPLGIVALVLLFVLMLED